MLHIKVNLNKSCTTTHKGRALKRFFSFIAYDRSRPSWYMGTRFFYQRYLPTNSPTEFHHDQQFKKSNIVFLTRTNDILLLTNWKNSPWLKFSNCPVSSLKIATLFFQDCLLSFFYMTSFPLLRINTSDKPYRYLEI